MSSPVPASTAQSPEDVVQEVSPSRQRTLAAAARSATSAPVKRATRTKTADAGDGEAAKTPPRARKAPGKKTEAAPAEGKD